MAGFTSKILNNANSALAATQALIATTGNNIANVNTPGYTRRTVQLETRQSSAGGQLNVGSGVAVAGVQRVSDKFLDSILQGATTDNGAAVVKKEFLDRIENLYSIDPDGNSIGGALTEFFTSVDDLSTNPANIDLRANVIQKAQALVDTISTTFNGLASLQTEADQRIAADIEVVNSLTDQIAKMNVLISQREGGGTGSEAADERDKRDELLRQLADKIGFSQVEQSDGSLVISLSNGFSLVNGATARRLEVTSDPSFAGTLPNSLSGGILNHIVYDYDQTAAQSHLDLTQVLKESGGNVGGLLEVRGFNAPTSTSPFQADGVIVEMASRVEAITRTLLTTFNQEYFGPDQNTTTAGYQSSARDLNGNPPNIDQYFGLFDFRINGSRDYVNDDQPTVADLNASGFDNFSSILKVGFTDPALLAAGRVDIDVVPPTPANFPKGDGRNAEALSQLQFRNNVSFSTGSFTFTGSFQGVYSESVTHIGNAKSRADVDASVAQSNLNTAQNKRDEVAGVSLDEEFSNLIRHQKAFEASARMIRVADELLQQIVSLI